MMTKKMSKVQLAILSDVLHGYRRVIDLKFPFTVRKTRSLRPHDLNTSPSERTAQSAEPLVTRGIGPENVFYI